VALDSRVHHNSGFAADEANFAFSRDATAVLTAGVKFDATVPQQRAGPGPFASGFIEQYAQVAGPRIGKL